MSKKIFFSLFLVMVVFGFWTCDKNNNNDSCTGAWASELNNEITAMSNAAQVYASNPTVANCNAYKQAAQDYLDALEPYGNCATLTGQDRVAWQNALDSAQQSVDNLDCSSAAN
jgi:hypothetical protein